MSLLHMRRGRPSTGATLGPTFFVKGAWLPEPGDAATWASRGINVAIAGKDDEFWAAGTWRAAMLGAGLKLIVRPDHVNAPTDTLTADNANANIIAFMTYDEPELQLLTPSQVQTVVDGWIAAGATKPFGVGFSGNGPSLENNGYSGWLAITSVKWKWSDLYAPHLGPLFYFGDYQANYDFTGNFTTMVGKAARLLLEDLPYQGARAGVPAASVFQFLQTGRVQSGLARLTAAEFRLQAWSSIINGCSGLFFFPQTDAGIPATFVADDTDVAMAGYLADLSTKLAILENQGGVNVLMDTANGGRRTYTLRKCCKTSGGSAGQSYPTAQPIFVAPTGNEMPQWFEGVEIAAGGDTYRLVVNLHDTTTKSLTDAAWGLSGVSFAAGQVKCFKASAPTTDIFA